MKHEVVGRPPGRDALRADFEEFLADLESGPSSRMRVMFGFAWANQIYDDDWLELDLDATELRTRVISAETAGLGSIGSDDLFIRLPDLGIERQYCHEADVHVVADDPAHPYLERERKKWLQRGWDVHTRGVA